MEEQQEVSISLSLREAKEIFLCLCDVSARLNYCGTQQVYQRLMTMWKKYDAISEDPACRQAMQFVVEAYHPKLEVSE